MIQNVVSEVILKKLNQEPQGFRQFNHSSQKNEKMAFQLVLEKNFEMTRNDKYRILHTWSI